MKKILKLLSIVFVITMLTSCQDGTYYNPKELRDLVKELKKEYKFISKIEMYCASDPADLYINLDVKIIPDNKSEDFDLIVTGLTEYFLSEEFDQFMNQTDMAYNHDAFMICIRFYYDNKLCYIYDGLKRTNYAEWLTRDFDDNDNYTDGIFTISNDEEE